MGLRNSMPTIIMGKIEMEFPDIYIMNKFMGICLMGPNAMSHDFFTIRLWSVSRLASP
jgi:hypothetical protein